MKKGLLLLIALLGFWELSATYNIIDPFITSSPSRIINQIKLLIDSNSLMLHITTTLSETIYAFL